MYLHQQFDYSADNTQKYAIVQPADVTAGATMLAKIMADAPPTITQQQGDDMRPLEEAHTRVKGANVRRKWHVAGSARS